MNPITVYYTDYSKLVSYCTESFANLRMAKISFQYGSNVQFFFDNDTTPSYKNDVINKINAFITSAPCENKFYNNPDGFRFFPNNTFKDSNDLHSGLILYQHENGLSKDVVKFISLVDEAISKGIEFGENNFFIALKMGLSILVESQLGEIAEISNRAYIESIQIITASNFVYANSDIYDVLNTKQETYDGMLSNQPDFLEYLTEVKSAIIDNCRFDEAWIDGFIEKLPAYKDVYNSPDEAVNTLVLIANKLNICDDQMGYLFFLIKTIS